MSGAEPRELTDPAYVRRQYASEQGLATRRAIYANAAGPDAHEVVLDAVREAAPGSVLDVGCGEGELAERIQGELGATVVAIDQSARMVEISRARGVDAGVADAQRLPFEDGEFDVVLAAWVLHHVRDIPATLVELRRVLRPGGRLVAATNRADHLQELWHLAGIDRLPLTFGAEDGAEHLASHFERVERHDVGGTVTLFDADAVRRYIASSGLFADRVALVPELDRPLVARRRSVVFVAEKTP
ncbi:MAG: methyltransferase domain-containing protein [Thermoleophilia bacterium]|nr:methyltransferase domain-containing protein [Thermoleophilia bacterium]MDH4346364.1 methyltransferase domain-containing protein [Thermoleophilia bacterium]